MNHLVAIANDHAGVALKAALLPVIKAAGFDVLDLGTDTADSVDYSDYGYKLADAVTQGRAQFGIALCGSGIGISIAANRKPGARAALCMTPEMAMLARQHNDANIICFGARLMDDSVAKDCAQIFLTTPFDGGERHTRRVEKLG